MQQLGTIIQEWCYHITLDETCLIGRYATLIMDDLSYSMPLRDIQTNKSIILTGRMSWPGFLISDFFSLDPPCFDQVTFNHFV